MALKIRLTRLGDKGNAFYRVIVAESRSPRDGKFIASIGTFDPHGEDDAIKIDKDAALGWIGKGALPTDTAKAVLVKAGVIPAEEFKPKPNAKTPVPKARKKEKK
jgi:small subunit ribosomal protein S16